ncbi:MAG: hypothetical protein QFX31_07355 [Methanothrix sp.]|uniref:hypothetical protein n=1 Tax=Methanothrix sp. TaxID=90426 RepID=UPI0032AF92BD|nr:hypothetical protein [Methanothrix sp.]
MVRRRAPAPFSRQSSERSSRSKGIEGLGGNYMNIMRIAIIGAGCAGLTTGAALAHIGHCVTCMESDGIKLAALEGGRYTIREQGVEECLIDPSA